MKRRKKDTFQDKVLLHLIESDHDTENYITVCLLCFRKIVVLTMNGDSPRIFNCWVYNFRIFCTACQYFFMVSFSRTKIERWNCHIATIWILKSNMNQFTESHMKDYSHWTPINLIMIAIIVILIPFVLSFQQTYRLSTMLLLLEVETQMSCTPTNMVCLRKMAHVCLWWQHFLVELKLHIFISLTKSIW